MTRKQTYAGFKVPHRPKIPKAEKQHGSLFSKPGWRLGLASAMKQPEKVSGPGEQPAYGPYRKGIATRPEFYCGWALERLGKKIGIDYNYRGEVAFTSSLALSAQLDFTMLDGSQIAFEIEGIHWHYGLGAQKIAYDQLRIAELTSSGWTVIEIDEDDALRDPMFYVKEALAGRSHAYRYKPYFVNPIGGNL